MLSLEPPLGTLSLQVFRSWVVLGVQESTAPTIGLSKSLTPQSPKPPWQRKKALNGNLLELFQLKLSVCTLRPNRFVDSEATFVL